MTENKKLIEELSVAYNKAQTKEEYKEVVKRGKEIEALLSKEESFGTIAPIILPAYWAKYYLLLKFPAPTEIMDKFEFASKIRTDSFFIADPDTKIAFLYLESVAWNMVSGLMYDQKRARECTATINKIISEGKVSVASILRYINSGIVKEMADKNWREAVIISKEIEKFPKEIIEQPKNLRHSANIINNRGASYIRGDIDIVKGRKSLLIAKDYYLREKVPSKNHLDGIKNRLREADEKS